MPSDLNPHKAAQRSAIIAADICCADAVEMMDLAQSLWRQQPEQSLMFCRAAAASLLFARKMRFRAHYYR